MCAGIGDQSQIECQVVDAGYLHGQQLLCFEQVVQIGFRIAQIHFTAVGVNGCEVGFPFLVAHVHRAVVSEQHRITTVACRHHAVEHIHTALDGFENVLRRTHTHEVAGLVLRKNLIHHLDHLVHHLRRFAYRQTTDGITVGTLVGNKFRSLLSQVLIGTALNDGEEALLIAVERFRFVEMFDASV